MLHRASGLLLRAMQEGPLWPWKAWQAKSGHTWKWSKGRPLSGLALTARPADEQLVQHSNPVLGGLGFKTQSTAINTL